MLTASATRRQDQSDHSTSTNDGKEQLRIRIVQTLTQLFLWRLHWEDTFGGMTFEVPVNAKDMIYSDSTGQPLFHTHVYFRDFHSCGRSIILYDTALILLLDLAEKFEMNDASGAAVKFAVGFRGANVAARSVLKMPSSGMTADDGLREMCRTLDCHLVGATRGAGVGTLIELLMPLRIALQFAKPGSGISIVQAVMRRIARSYGFRPSRMWLQSSSSGPTGRISNG